VKNPTGTSRNSNSLPSHAAAVFGGTRYDFTVDDIIAANGPRLPSYDQSQKAHRIAFVLVIKPGASATDQASKLQGLHNAWVPYFNQLTGGEAWVATNLQSEPSTSASKIYFPYYEGNISRYTGFAIANWARRRPTSCSDISQMRGARRPRRPAS